MYRSIYKLMIETLIGSLVTLAAIGVFYFILSSRNTVNNDPVTYVKTLYSSTDYENKEYFINTIAYHAGAGVDTYRALFPRFKSEEPKVVILDHDEDYVLYKFNNRFLDGNNLFRMDFTFDSKGNIVTATETELD